MIKVGVQTKGILEKGMLEQGLDMIRKAGFDCVDFNLDAFLLNSDVYAGKLNDFFDKSQEELEKFFGQYRDLLRKYGIVPSQMHAPYPVSVFGKDVQNRYMTGQVIPKSFLIAFYLGIPYMVIHPWKLQYQLGKEEEKKQNMEYFKSLIPLIRKYHVMVCLENLYEGNGTRIVEGVGSNPMELVQWVEELNAYAGEELFGICLDTGHLNLMKRTPYQMITGVGEHLKILHLHDNDAVGDLHQMPYTFQNEEMDGMGIDWKEVLDGLREIQFEGTLSFETFPCMNSFPGAVKQQALNTIQDIGRYWGREIE